MHESRDDQIKWIRASLKARGFEVDPAQCESMAEVLDAILNDLAKLDGVSNPSVQPSPSFRVEVTDGDD